MIEKRLTNHEFIGGEFPNFIQSHVTVVTEPTCCDHLQGEGEIAGGPPARSASGVESEAGSGYAEKTQASLDDRICISLPGCKII